MSAIGPGDFVEATRDVPGWFTSGTVDRVRRFVEGFMSTCVFCGSSGPAIEFDKTPTPPHCLGWCACAWKPIYRPKPDAFAHLLKSPEIVDA